MQSNLRIHQRVIYSVMLCLAMMYTISAHAESEAYRRQVKFETDRAKAFRSFQQMLEDFDRMRNAGVQPYKTAKEKEELRYEESRKEYSVNRKIEEAKKPTDEFVEMMLAKQLEEDEKLKEQARKEYKAIQEEIERAVINSRLDEAEEYQIDR